ncbi:pre-mRNA-processing factor [Planoprotostelium fungivorum]|uniref:Pre-mRNA-processing factor n=1 Tax=Planoprotostelium fungivorum TaxID=1890364 RepID=A0A2P6MRV7_9EUKA|nr:pre-mRNA-processing factor [Planoprotostelium fungivorum]
MSGSVGLTKGDWTEYFTDDRKKYYHNKKTNSTTWDKPLEFKSTEELAATPCVWKEFTHDSGRKYYYNSSTKTSVWEEPTEYKLIRDAQEIMRQKNGEPEIDDKPAPMSEKQKNAIFHQLLESKLVTSTWTWDMAMRAIINDERYGILPSLSEKKASFTEYVTNRKNHEREEQRKKTERQKEALFDMLRNCEHARPGASWRKVLSFIEFDPRLNPFTPQELPGLYDDFLYIWEREQKEQAAQARKENMQKLLSTFQADKTITWESVWRQVKAEYETNAAYQALDKNDRLTVFQDYMRDLERDEENRKRAEQTNNRVRSRKNREAFRRLLLECYQDGRLGLHTKWKDFQESIKSDERYLHMVEPTQTGSLPSELFGDFLDELEETFMKERKKIKEIVQELPVEFSVKMSEADFLAAISRHQLYQSLNPRFHSAFYLDFMDHLAEEEKRRVKAIESKKKHAEERFLDLLYDAHVKPATKWEEIRETISEKSAFQAIPTEEDRLRLFNDFVTVRHTEYEGGDREKRHKKEKKHKSHKRHRDDDRDRRRDDRKRRASHDRRSSSPPAEMEEGESRIE